MAGLLSGLGKLGLGSLEEADIFTEEEKKSEPEKKAAPVLTESDYLYDKKFTCPVCENSFTSKTVRSGKVKLDGTDMDLRPRYVQMDALKYDIVACPHCGYSALAKNFDVIGQKQIELIRKKIAAVYTGQEKPDAKDYSYDEAIERYKLALASALVKQGKTSERAYICLKTAWVYRGKRETMPTDIANRQEVLTELGQSENEFLKNALEGFIAARGTESYPMCGMDELTVDYLIAALSAHFGQMAIAKKLLSTILVSRTVNKRLKDKALDLKEMIVD